MRFTALIAALFLAVLVAPASAQVAEQGAISLDRLSIATGLDYAWYSPSADDLILPDLQKKEWEIPLNVSYNMVATAEGKPLLSLISGVSWGFDSHIVKSRVGLRVILFSGGR
jgi:hypothetical protein